MKLSDKTSFMVALRKTEFVLDQKLNSYRLLYHVVKSYGKVWHRFLTIQIDVQVWLKRKLRLNFDKKMFCLKNEMDIWSNTTMKCSKKKKTEPPPPPLSLN